MSSQDLAEGVIDNIVAESRASSRSDRVVYSSAEEFFRLNPSCCFVRTAGGRTNDMLDLPLDDDVTLLVRYRRDVGGEAPYALVYVTFGRCPDTSETAAQALTAEQYRAALRHHLGRQVK